MVRLLQAWVAVLSLCAAGFGGTPSVAEVLATVEAHYRELRNWEEHGTLLLEVVGFSVLRVDYSIVGRFPLVQIQRHGDEAQLRMLPWPSTVIADVELGRQWTRYPGVSELWWGDELELGWPELVLVGMVPLASIAFTSVEVGERDGVPVWVLHGRGQLEVWDATVKVWVDQGSMRVTELMAEILGFVSVRDRRERRPASVVSAEGPALPSAPAVRFRTPRLPKAHEIMDGVNARYGELSSFYVRLIERVEGWDAVRTELWYHNLSVREDRIVHPPSGYTQVRIEEPGRFVHCSCPVSPPWGSYETTYYPPPPILWRRVVLAQAFGLPVEAMRYTTIEQDELNGRRAWKITGEERNVCSSEAGTSQWWIDQETGYILKHEGPKILFHPSLWILRYPERRSVEIEAFEPNAVVSPEKFIPPAECGSIRMVGELAIGERAEEGLPWEPYSVEALAAAWETGKPVLLYFTADWCRPCRELEDEAFHDRRVLQEADGFVRLRVDLTDWSSPMAAELRAAYRVVALPTVVVLRGDGAEAGREEGVVPAGELLRLLRRVGP